METQLLQVISLDGTYDTASEPDLSNEQLKKLYYFLVLVRTLDQKCMNLQRQGRIGFYVPCIGQEASHIGSAYALEPQDWIFPAYREPGAILIRGYPLSKLISQFIGNSNDPLKGRQMPNHFGDRSVNYVTPSSPVATQVPQATGAAMAAKILGDKNVVLTFFGDGATSTGDFHAGMNFAGVFQAPVVFVCQNNQYAISVPVQKQTASESIAIKARAYGFEGVRVDGNDILAVYRTVKEAVDKARSGKGPTLIESVTYRMGPHSTSDDPTRYRAAAEVDEWRKRDPVERFRLYLSKKNLLNEKEDQETRERATKEIDDAVAQAEKFPPPSIESMFEDVYASMPWNLKEQMDEAVRLNKKDGG
jgi:pyruvate dehydrogenase E1 component subunit alpha